ncbi:MAG: hypothetical protein NVS3B21_25020 [Acidimicrobiales bacterium]
MGRRFVPGPGPDDSASEAALVHLVDLPDVTAAVICRLLTQGALADRRLARAAYSGAPGIRSRQGGRIA